MVQGPEHHVIERDIFNILNLVHNPSSDSLAFSYENWAAKSIVYLNIIRIHEEC